ncbi:MaoC like domain protein [Legionella massiliensis]|uniref:MaoC like domain protein n=1 Tax=Legionella massiliensis TaxID=1034943 RepID=A0A078L1P3_9GAMM|nr:MaoC family dehydratase [Legionella massiliensis]CDZ77914.1 MaoC like domain protein [Legionella massiliensis]CEE13652.1 MaoC like domain protein [Legionella massiliensis]
MAEQNGSLLYLDDFKVGQRFISDSHSLDAQQIKTFAAQFDPQPFHLDEKQAQNTFFGELIASGWHTAAITMRLLVNSFGHRIAGGLIGRGGEISWPNPAHATDILHVESEVLELKPSITRPDWGTIKIQSLTLNQQQQVVQKLIAEVMLQRKKVYKSD